MARRPNLLYIHSDQHNPFVTGCYGDSLVQTPHLDQLAREGTLFHNVYCSSPLCGPSRASMLTGQQPYQHQVWTNQHMLDSAIPTLAHALGAAGYRPVLIGRLDVMGPDQLHGYTARLVGDHTPNYVGGPEPDRGILTGANDPERASLERTGAGLSAYQVHDEDVAAAAVEFLETYAAGKDAEPFNLTLGFMLPHAPFVARREDYDQFAGQVPLPSKPRPIEVERHPHLRWWRGHTESAVVAEAEVARARAAYWALVSRLDALIGQVLTTLARLGLRENTLIVYTSDHGDMLGEHGLWWKHVFYEESVKVPLIVSWPGVLPAGQQLNQVVSALDVGATILDALGAPPLPHGSGRSLLPLIRGEAPDWEDVAFSEYCVDQFCPPEGCFHRMVRQGDWKLIYYHGQPPQLFNLADDPAELIDRAGDPDCAAIQAALTEQLLADWDPDWVRERLAAKRADLAILRDWAKQTEPAETIRWQMRPDMNFLEEV
ncbi:MAG: sulfatase-like hydrolase/transferase [Anaerolineales bacterium]|nr:sulfatase-like hydrolase/transferase [Anaerolineales bacterium]